MGFRRLAHFAFFFTILVEALCASRSNETPGAENVAPEAVTDRDSFTLRRRNLAPGVSSLHKRHGINCSPDSKPPVGDCGNVIRDVQNANTTDPMTVKQTSCASYVKGGCKAMFCACGDHDVSLDKNLVVDALEDIWGACVFTGEGEGFAYDCYDPKVNCQSWGIYLTST